MDMSITMMQGHNKNVKVTLGITSFTDYLAIYMIYHCGVALCLYNVMSLYNTIMSSAMIITLSKLRKMESNFHWKTLLATVAPNGITVNQK